MAMGVDAPEDSKRKFCLQVNFLCAILTPVQPATNDSLGRVLSSRPMASARLGENSGDLIRRLRVKRGLTQRDLASQLGITVRALRHLETGQTRRLRGKTADLLLVALDATPEDLGIGASSKSDRKNLTAAQQAIVDDILSLPSEDVEVIREAMRLLAAKRRGRK